MDWNCSCLKNSWLWFWLVMTTILRYMPLQRQIILPIILIINVFGWSCSEIRTLVVHLWMMTYEKLLRSCWLQALSTVSKCRVESVLRNTKVVILFALVLSKWSNIAIALVIILSRVSRLHRIQGLASLFQWFLETLLGQTELRLSTDWVIVLNTAVHVSLRSSWRGVSCLRRTSASI